MHAYLDPGSGSMLLGLVASGMADGINDGYEKLDALLTGL